MSVFKINIVNKYINEMVTNWIVMKEILLEKNYLGVWMNEYLDWTRNV